MANDIVQTIAEARVDARSLSEFVFKPADFMVARRLAPSVRTLQYYVDFFNTLQSNIATSVSAAQSSLNNSVAEAQGKVAYIESTVQDAINNTAVEGGVLADTFVVVDGTLSQRTINKGAESIADLSTINNPKDGLRVYVKSYHAGKGRGGGYFIYDSTRAAENDGGNIINGWVRQVPNSYLSVHNFGAVGDGATDYTDQEGFERLSARVKASPDSEGSLYIHINSGYYVVGRQEDIVPDMYWSTSPINTLDVSFDEFKEKSVFVKSDAARLVLRDGLYFGSFNNVTKEAYHPVTMPFTRSTPEFVSVLDTIVVSRLPRVLHFYNFSDLVFCGSIDVDMNAAGQIIGGKYGDVGHQVICQGLYIKDVMRFSVENITTHDSLLDGVSLNAYYPSGTDDKMLADCKGILRNIRSYNNSRQGTSLVGGQNITFYSCKFYDNGIDSLPISSAPASSFDIEAEAGKHNRNIKFYDCFFGRAGTISMVMDTGTSENIQFNDCVFLNDKTAVWPNKPNVEFNSCEFYGRVLRTYQTVDKSKMTTFNNCSFADHHPTLPSMAANLTGDFCWNVNTGTAIFNNCDFKQKYSKGFFASPPVGAQGIELNDCTITALHDVTTGLIESNIRGASGMIRLRDWRGSASRDSGNWRMDISRSNLLVVVEDLEGRTNGISVASASPTQPVLYSSKSVSMIEILTQLLAPIVES